MKKLTMMAVVLVTCWNATLSGQVENLSPGEKAEALKFWSWAKGRSKVSGILKRDLTSKEMKRFFVQELQFKNQKTEDDQLNDLLYQLMGNEQTDGFKAARSDESREAGNLLGYDRIAARFREATPIRLQVKRGREHLYLSNATSDEDWVKGYREHLKKAKPALFSLTRDFENDKSIWQAQGYVGRPIRLVNTEKKSTLWFIPGISFDRVTDSFGNLEEANQIAFEGEFVWKKDLTEKKGDSKVLEHGFDLSFKGGYTTDFDFESEIIALELATAYDLTLALTELQAVGDPRLTVRAELRAVYGDVLDAGDKSSLVGRDDFFRVGSRVELRFDAIPEKEPAKIFRKSLRDGLSDFWSRFSVYVSYTHLEAFSSNTETISRLNAGLEFAISENMGVGLDYAQGDMDTTGDDVQFLTISLTVKF